MSAKLYRIHAGHNKPNPPSKLAGMIIHHTELSEYAAKLAPGEFFTPMHVACMGVKGCTKPAEHVCHDNVFLCSDCLTLCCDM